MPAAIAVIRRMIEVISRYGRSGSLEVEFDSLSVVVGVMVAV